MLAGCREVFCACSRSRDRRRARAPLQHSWDCTPPWCLRRAPGRAGRRRSRHRQTRHRPGPSRRVAAVPCPAGPGAPSPSLPPARLRPPRTDGSPASMPRCRRGRTANSANAPPDRPVIPNTLVTRSKAVTPAPTASTVPATSHPRMLTFGVRRPGIAPDQWHALEREHIEWIHRGRAHTQQDFVISSEQASRPPRCGRRQAVRMKARYGSSHGLLRSRWASLAFDRPGACRLRILPESMRPRRVQGSGPHARLPLSPRHDADYQGLFRSHPCVQESSAAPPVEDMRVMFRCSADLTITPRLWKIEGHGILRIKHLQIARAGRICRVVGCGSIGRVASPPRRSHSIIV